MRTIIDYKKLPKAMRENIVRKEKLAVRKILKARASMPAFVSTDDGLVINHPVEDDFLMNSVTGNVTQGDLVMLDDPNLLGHAGVSQIHWSDIEIHDFWLRMVEEALADVTAEDLSKGFSESLEWIASAQFYDVCEKLGLDATAFYIDLPHIIRKQHDYLSRENEKIVVAFERYKAEQAS